MTTPKQDAIALLKKSEIQPAVLAAISAALEDAPRDERGQLDLPALIARDNGEMLEVTSRRIKNLTVKWQEVLFKFAMGESSIEMSVPLSNYPVVRHILELLYALQILSGAMDIKLSDKSAEIVRELWLNRKDTASVPERELAAALSDKISEDELPLLLGSLQTLGILVREGDNITKREKFTLVA